MDSSNVACFQVHDHRKQGTGAKDVSPYPKNRALGELFPLERFEGENQRPSDFIDSSHGFTSKSEVSINSLPAEALMLIFEQVRSLQPCVTSDERTPTLCSWRDISKSPITLSHVCTDWRRLALGLPNLWTHIDLGPLHFRCPTQRARLDAFMTRSGQALIDIHMIEPPRNVIFVFDSEDADELLKFFALVAPRTWSINLVATRSLFWSKFFRSALGFCIENCQPGILTQMTIQVAEGRRPDFTDSSPQALFGQTRERVEALCLPITDLRLSSFHFPWGSGAYHELAVLHLSGSGVIPELQLVAILKSSPRLQVFKFRIKIENPHVGSDPIEPVRLEDLEVLVISSDEEWYLGCILRWITPGTKPLSLSIVNPFLRGSNFPSKSVVASFFARSNVTHLHATSFDGYLELMEVLRLSSTIRVLAVDSFHCNQLQNKDGSSSDLIIDALYVIRSSQFGHGIFNWHTIEAFIKKHQVQSLILWKYDFRYCGIGTGAETTIPDNLSTICPHVRVLANEDPNPVGECC
ncbi:hypothetical protein OPQ81_008565 [Rhizoctonia solani]|nr:hypothetical protein OPQ81_008565 [Rhizoctonia solani]